MKIAENKKYIKIMMCVFVPFATLILLFIRNMWPYITSLSITTWLHIYWKKAICFYRLMFGCFIYCYW